MKADTPIPLKGAKNKMGWLRLAWITTLGLSLLGWLIVILFLDATSFVAEDGILHEPLFGLVPISMFFLLISIVLALGDIIRLFWHKNKK